MILRSAAAIIADLSPRPVTVSDGMYVFPQRRWFLDSFLPWWGRHRIEAGMAFRDEGMDCDNFATSFLAAINDASRKSEVRPNNAAGRMRVHNAGLSLGIGAGEHELNLVGTETAGRIDWLVVEPQTSQYENLHNYRPIVRGIAF